MQRARRRSESLVAMPVSESKAAMKRPAASMAVPQSKAVRKRPAAATPVPQLVAARKRPAPANFQKAVKYYQRLCKLCDLTPAQNSVVYHGMCVRCHTRVERLKLCVDCCTFLRRRPGDGCHACTMAAEGVQRLLSGFDPEPARREKREKALRERREKALRERTDVEGALGTPEQPGEGED